MKAETITTGRFGIADMRLRNRIIRQFSGGRIERLANASISSLQCLFMRTHKDHTLLRFIKQTRKELDGPLADEAFLLYSVAQAQTSVPGDYAEVGVYRGGSARIICEAKGEKRLHLFDTFTGLPEPSEKDGGVFRRGQYCCPRKEVERALRDFDNVVIYEGVFPQTVGGVYPIQNTTFSFVNLDVDLFDATSAALRFFYPRLNSVGILISHDYSVLPGVRTAFDEYFRDKREQVIELPTTQCMCVKP